MSDLPFSDIGTDPNTYNLQVVDSPALDFDLLDTVDSGKEVLRMTLVAKDPADKQRWLGLLRKELEQRESAVQRVQRYTLSPEQAARPALLSVDFSVMPRGAMSLAVSPKIAAKSRTLRH
jgi:hypothetical protein